MRNNGFTKKRMYPQEETSLHGKFHQRVAKIDDKNTSAKFCINGLQIILMNQVNAPGQMGSMSVLPLGEQRMCGTFAQQINLARQIFTMHFAVIRFE